MERTTAFARAHTHAWVFGLRQGDSHVNQLLQGNYSLKAQRNMAKANLMRETEMGGWRKIHQE